MNGEFLWYSQKNLKNFAAMNHMKNFLTMSLEQKQQSLKRSYDTNSFIRALSAEILAKIPNERSKSILFMLANDRHCFVRTEAYDSLSVFSDKETAGLLSEKISSESDDLALSYAVILFAQICRYMDMINMAMIEKGTTGQGIIEMAFIKRQEQNIIQKVYCEQ